VASLIPSASPPYDGQKTTEMHFDLRVTSYSLRVQLAVEFDIAGSMKTGGRVSVFVKTGLGRRVIWNGDCPDLTEDRRPLP
jgi:hypothetical protein